MLNQQRISIYTIGHSTRKLEELIHILKGYKINTLIDIRRFPGSRKYPHFSKEQLQFSLPPAGIDYFWLGEELGGFRRGGYENYTLTPEFHQGIKKLLSLAKEKRVAIMCAEALWFRCHRRFIANYLVTQKINIIHIYDERRSTVHKLRTKNEPTFL